jgi:EmrB/QacA subfamily drug resistance transporter
VLIGSCTGLFVLMLDSTVVTLALPAIRPDLDASADDLQWVQNAYLLTLTATVVTAGRLGDIFGRRRIFVIGMAIFGAGSLLAGAANDPDVLIVARVAQGIGGAALLTLSLALTSDAFPPEQRARALGIWAAVSAIALAIGPLVGGVLIELASWRWIFFVNVPVVVAGVAILVTRGWETRDETASSRVDLPGVGMLALGLTAIVYALVEADEAGWDSVQTIGLLLGGIAVLAGFHRFEGQREAPLVDFSLFRNRPYLGASAAAFGLVGAYWTVMYFEPQYLQGTLDYSPTAAGALILPITVPMVLFSPFSGRLIGRFGARATMTVGMLFGLVGLVLIAVRQDSSDIAGLLPGYLCFGIALALVYAPMSTAAMAAMPPEKAGIASGVLAMDRVFAGALILAISGAVFQANNSVADAMWPAIGVLAIAAALTWALVRSPDRGAEGPGPDELVHHQHHRRFHL